MKNPVTLALALFLSLPLFSLTSRHQVISTGMRITVLSRLGNPVENAIAGPAFTDAKGRVTFKNLGEKQYFVQAIKGDANNYGDAEQTGKLLKGKLNKFNIVIQ